MNAIELDADAGDNNEPQERRTALISATVTGKSNVGTGANGYSSRMTTMRFTEIG